jgi:REP element-mobilizing transposase RayT
LDRGRPARITIPASADRIGWRSRGYLPHLDVPNLVQHVVFRVADSLPAHLREELAKLPAVERVEAIEAALDSGHGRRDLALPEVGGLAQGALLRFDGERYALFAWCVMPTHVHALIETRKGHSLDRIVHSWKSFTAHAANQLLERSERFWAPEYFDRYMRDDHQLAATQAYIEANPVKAGLCNEPTEWPYSSAFLR